MNKRYQVFVSSTYADLKEERAKVIQTIMELDCIPAGMEIFPAIDEEQFEFIKKIIDDCDYYLLIIGGRYGSLSEDGISYTEKEYNYAIEKNIKVLAFIHSNPNEIPLGKSEKDSKLRQKLEDFKIKVTQNRIVRFWSRSDELPGLVSLSLSKTIKTYPAIGWIRANTSTDPYVYKQLSELQKENQDLKEIGAASLKGAIISLDNLANLNDNFKVKGLFREWDKSTRNYYESNWEITITWGKLFSQISPYLIDHPNDEKIKSILSDLLFKLIPEYSKLGVSYIDDQDFQTIKIHLKALGLIDIKYTKSIQGSMGLFWSLTSKGDQLMLELRSVKK